MTALLAAALLAACAPRTSGDAAGRGRLPELVVPDIRLAEDGPELVSFDPPGAGAQLVVDVPVTFTNNNRFVVMVSGAEGELTLGQEAVARLPVRLDAITLLPAQSVTQTLRLSFSLRQDPGLLGQVAELLRGAALPLSLAGQFSYSSEHHRWSTSSTFTDAAELKSSVKVEAPSLHIVASDSSAFFLGGDVPVVRVLLEVSNPGQIGYLLHGKDLLLLIGGQAVASVDLPPAPVPAGSSNRVALNFLPLSSQLTPEARSALSDALAGAPAELSVLADLAVDVVGLDTFRLPAGEALTALIHTD